MRSDSFDGHWNLPRPPFHTQQGATYTSCPVLKGGGHRIYKYDAKVGRSVPDRCGITRDPHGLMIRVKPPNMLEYQLCADTQGQMGATPSRLFKHSLSPSTCPPEQLNRSDTLADCARALQRLFELDTRLFVSRISPKAIAGSDSTKFFSEKKRPAVRSAFWITTLTGRVAAISGLEGLHTRR